tara:strand:- start:448 stop:609 length:162 start_codon:yes stop_codon:yes gene_type:complete
MNDEMKMIDITLDANLKMLRLIDGSKIKEKKQVVVAIALELRKLCDNLIKAYS